MTKNKHTPAPWRVVRANPSPTTGEWMIAGAIPGYLADFRKVIEKLKAKNDFNFTQS